MCYGLVNFIRSDTGFGPNIAMNHGVLLHHSLFCCITYYLFSVNLPTSICNEYKIV
jgi:hypothetical protein